MKGNFFVGLKYSMFIFFLNRFGSTKEKSSVFTVSGVGVGCLPHDHSGDRMLDSVV